MKQDTFITDIYIKKVRHLKDFTISLGKEKKHLILTGKNGSGKTSILEELNKIFIEIDSPREAYNKFENTLYPILNKNTRDKSSEEEGFIHAFFSAKRRDKKMIAPKGAKKIELPTDRRAKLNDYFLQYLVNLNIDLLFAKVDDNKEKIELLEKWFLDFNTMMKQIFDDSFKIELDRTDYIFWIERDNREPFTFNTLSAGYWAIMDIVSEIIMKISTTKSKSFDCEGIILIDEIDIHLHVELQKDILPMLTTFFPNIQFIVTTHSPFVLSSLSNTVICDLEKKFVTEDLSSYSYDALIESYFDSDKYSKEIKGKIEIFEQLSDRNDLSMSEKDEYYKLKKYFDTIPTFMADELAVKINEIKLKQMFKAD